MRKVILGLSLLIGGFLHAQFHVTDGYGNLIENNQLIAYNTTVQSESELRFLVHNTSNEDLIMKVKVDQITNSNGQNVQLCFGALCFFAVNEGNVYPPNYPVVIAPGETNNQYDHFWNGNEGDGTNYPMDYVLKIVQYDANDNLLGEVFTFTYRYDPTLSTTDFNTVSQLGISIKNTMVKDFLQLNVEQNASVELFDLTGKSVGTFKLNQGDQALDLNNLAASVYVAKFTTTEGKKANVRIVKQ